MSDDSLLIAKALSAPAPQSPFVLDQAMEEKAAPLSPPLNPLIQALMQRLGLMNMIRNRRNINIVDPEMPVS